MNNKSDQNPAEDADLATAKRLHTLDLIFALCEDRITPEQFQQLDSLVCNDKELAGFYVDIMQLRSSLRRFAFYFAPPVPQIPADHRSKAEPACPIDLSDSMNESMVLPALSEIEAEGSEENVIERFQPAPSSVEPTPPKSPQIPKGGLAALLILGFGLIAYVLFSMLASAPNHPTVAKSASRANSTTSVPDVTVSVAPAPPPIPVATLNFTQKAAWSATHAPPADGNFFASQLLELDGGDIQLSFSAGGRLVIEGPAEIEFVSQHIIALHRGKIVATVPGGGLVVECPNGSVKDLGTQFGVQVNPDRTTEVAVFQGRVAASLNSPAATQPSKPLLLDVGQAAVMTQTALTVDTKGAQPQQFVRSLVNGDINSLDVTDLICGGDGTTHRRGIGIDPSTGMVGQLRPVFAINSDGKYHRANGYPFIDGAFIVDATKDETVVDSVGDRFHIPALGTTSYNFIFTGGKIPWPEKPEPDTVLNGVDYSTSDHSIICIHPNNAVTVDLDAVRRIYPDLSLKSFHCRVGISGTLNPKYPKIPDAAVWVLTDGSLRFQNPHFTIFDGSFEVNVPLKETDRFMTMVSTYAGPGNYRNWVLWVDPKLDLSAGQ